MGSGPHGYSVAESGFEFGPDPFSPRAFLFGSNIKITNYEIWIVDLVHSRCMVSIC